ncbi:MAG: hypothetical protein P9L93_02045 [Candidatus Gorgyraea atricola]|nr:hypothetical protein [Candidatus Gorgyraea atricola]
MTYIVGIRKPEHNFLTIISDLMVTKKIPDGKIQKENNALKTGYLFDGCIYGLSGDATAGHKFLGSFKKSIDCKNSVKNNVEKLSNFIKSSKWNSGSGFKVLFGIRNPNPEFFLLDSHTREFKLLDECLYTMGSGQMLLDKIVSQAYNYSNSFIMEKLKQKKAPIVYYPCFICLWLSELVLGFEEKQLSEIGVGGIFHYVYQADKKECSPMPIVFVLSKLENNKLVQKSYRVCLINGYLIIENLSDGSVSVFTSEVERQDLAEKGLLDSDDILQEARKRSRNLPIYYFCGFATHDPSYRGFYSAHFSCNEIKVIDWEGNVRSDFQDKVDKNLRISQELNK